MTLNKEGLFQFPPNGKAHFKLYAEGLAYVHEHVSIPSERERAFQVLWVLIPNSENDLFQFPPNGKPHFKKNRNIARTGTKLHFNSLRTGNRISSVALQELENHAINISIPSERESAFQATQAYRKWDSYIPISIPSERESAFQDGRRVLLNWVLRSNFNSLRTGKRISRLKRSPSNSRTRSFNSLRTGNRFSRALSRHLLP